LRIFVRLRVGDGSELGQPGERQVESKPSSHDVSFDIDPAPVLASCSTLLYYYNKCNFSFGFL
jgi:hypothetical protein